MKVHPHGLRVHRVHANAGVIFAFLHIAVKKVKIFSVAFLLLFVNSICAQPGAAGGAAGVGAAPGGGIASKDKIKVDIVGDGNLQAALSKGQPIQANTGIGLSYVRVFEQKHFLKNLDFDFSINLASTADTLKAQLDAAGKLTNRRDFGAYMLLPVSAKQAASFNFHAYFIPYENIKSKFFSVIRRGIDGVQIRLVGSNNVWYMGDDKVSLGALLFRAGIFHEFFNDDQRLNSDQSISFTFGIAYSYRSIIGDIRQDEYADLRDKILGTRRADFIGTEFNLSFRLNKIEAELQMPGFLDTRKDRYPALLIRNSFFLSGF